MAFFILLLAGCQWQPAEQYGKKFGHFMKFGAILRYLSKTKNV